MQHIVTLGRLMLANARDILPVVAVIGFFQSAVVGKPLPQLAEVLVGLAFALLGLTLFVRGLGMSLFVFGQDLADAHRATRQPDSASPVCICAWVRLDHCGAGLVLRCRQGD